MTTRRQIQAGAIAAAIVVASMAALAQSPAGYAVPRTPWGDPDLQGIWPSTHMVGVPLERPAELGTRATLTDEEFKSRAAQNRAPGGGR